MIKESQEGTLEKLANSVIEGVYSTGIINDITAGIAYKLPETELEKKITDFAQKIKAGLEVAKSSYPDVSLRVQLPNNQLVRDVFEQTDENEEPNKRYTILSKEAEGINLYFTGKNSEEIKGAMTNVCFAYNMKAPDDIFITTGYPLAKQVQKKFKEIIKE